MCSSIVNNEIISHINLWQHSVNCKFITILTKWTCYIILVVARLIFLTCYCNMMISTIDSWPHKIYCTCINTNILLINVLLVDSLCYNTAIRCKHKSSKLCIYCNIPHTSCCKNFIIYLMNASTDNSNIIRCLVWLVCNTNSTRKVNKLNISSCLITKFYSKLK